MKMCVAEVERCRGTHEGQRVGAGARCRCRCRCRCRYTDIQMYRCADVQI
jgi:hypothetical protein